jgi:hypothetical protein
MTACKQWARLARSGQPVPGEIRLRALVEAIEIRAKIDRDNATIASLQDAGRAVQALAQDAIAREREAERMAAYHVHAAQHGCRKRLPAVCSPCYRAMLQERLNRGH